MATQDALTGKAVARALLEHTDTIDLLAREVDTLDLPAMRARLRPLAVTLAEIPARQRADQSRKAELGNLAERASKASRTAAEIAKARPGLRRDKLLDVAQSVASLAEDVATAAIAFGQDADLAARAATAMKGRTQSISADPNADAIGTVVRALHTDPPRPMEVVDWRVR